MKENYCRLGTMSVCTADDQSKCKFYEACSSSQKCLFRSIELIHLDGDKKRFHCSCTQAQDDKKKEIEEEQIIEAKEGNIPT